MTLLIIPPLLIHRLPSGRCVLTRKFLDGVVAYQKRWPGRVVVACEPASEGDSNLDQVEVDPRDLPFEFHVFPFADVAALQALLNTATVVLATLVPRQISLAPVLRESGKTVVFVAEFSLQTRRQIVRLEAKNTVKRLVRWRRESLHERNFESMLRTSAGVQCNGTPTHDAYQHISPNPLLYFDSRVTMDMLVLDATLQTRLQELKEHRPLRLAFSGRLIPVKGALMLPVLADRLLKMNVPFHLEIFGSGELEAALRHTIAQFSLESRVQLRGNVDFATQLVPHVSRQVDLFVCCHRQGDPSCTYLETLSCGTPIVGYDNEALRGIARASNAGWTASLDDIASLAAMIARLHENRSAIATAAKNALDFARQHTFEFTMNRRVEHLLQCHNAHVPSSAPASRHARFAQRPLFQRPPMKVKSTARSATRTPDVPWR